jgi:tRNA nucleotidyltransferase (CCA-adding enzyme)
MSKLVGDEMLNLNNFLDLKENSKLLDIFFQIKKAVGISYLVGGSVRDLILGGKGKDIDIEVHKLSLDVLQKILEKFGKVKLVGKQFGVFRVESFDIDWSIPRIDSKGRKPKVELFPDMTIKEACQRRDLTINAMAINLDFLLDKNFSGEVKILDPYYGLKDLKNKVLCAVDEKLFLDDPLRFYRVMQFIGRFEMNPDEKLSKICISMDLGGVARERIFDEIEKLFLKSKRPSLGIRWLKNIKRLKEVMPQVYDLIGIKQRSNYHPEGDVFEHTMQSLDAAAILDKYESEHEKLMIMFAVLCHDFGKVEKKTEDLRFIGHEKAGVKIAKKFMKRLTNNSLLTKSVEKLVCYHTSPVDFLDQGSKIKAFKRLASKLAPEVTLRQLALVSLCDVSGRNSKRDDPLDAGEQKFNLFMNKVYELSLDKGPEKPVLLGRHLVGIIPEGPKMGEILKKAYHIQIDEGIVNVEELKKRVLKP